MNATATVNASPFSESAKKNWYLSVKPASPKQTLSVKCANGKTYKYLGTGKVNVGDPVVIDFGGGTSYMMGNVTATENGITIKRTHALKPLFTFTTDPDKAAIKKNVEGMNKLEEAWDAAGYYNLKGGADTADQFRVVDFLIIGVLNAITVVAHPELASADALDAAKEYLAAEKPVPGLVFSKEYTDLYYGVWFDVLRHAESAEVILTGHYPGWEDDLLNCDFWKSKEYEALKIKTKWDKNGTAYYLYFKDGSKASESYFASCQEFRSMTNELVMRSSLSILIRGGFLNLLKAALSVEMPIKGFYKKLIAFADQIGSTECAALLKATDYENMTHANAAHEKGTAKKPNAVKAPWGKDFKVFDGCLTEYKGNDEVVVIPEGITALGEFVFSENDNIKKVILSDSVTQLKKCAFSFCSNLEEVVFSKNLTSIGRGCFFKCKALQAVDLSNTKVKTINMDTFTCCERLETVDLSKTKITGIKDNAFMTCSSLESVKLPETLLTISKTAFLQTNIKEIVIPASVNMIAIDAFDHPQSALKRIVFEGSAPIKFQLEGVGIDCVVVCKGGSELMEMLEKQNAELKVRQAKYSNPMYSPRKLEEY